MTKKLVLFDVDDTIIDHSAARSEIPEKTIKAIKGLKDKGHYVGIATGRSLAHIKHIMEVLDIHMAVCYGGHLVILNDKEIFRQVIDVKEINRLVKRMYRSIYPMICFDQDHIYVKDFFGRLKREMYKEENTIEGEERIGNITPMIKLDRKEREYLTVMVFTPKLSKMESYKNLDFNPWGKLGYEVYSKGISKYSGIKVLAKALEISLDHVYAFGDNYNDIHMLTHVVNSVAVGNGVQEVKDVASYISPPISEGGIMTACLELGLLEEIDE